MAEGLVVEQHESDAGESTPSSADPSFCASVSQFSHPVYKQVSLTNGRINKMKKDEIKSNLAELGLDTRGHKDVLKKRLKTYYKNRKLAEAKIKKKKQTHYDYFVVIDFEATCDTHNPENFNHEIIEFPALLINTRTVSVEDEFHSYVKPSVNWKLTDFCKNLTGITQQQVDTAETFDCVLEKMTKWMASHQLGSRKSFAIITDGPWDMSRFMYLQCQSSHIPMPKWSQHWVNLRKSFCNFYGVRHAKLATMLSNLGLAFEGHPHSGLHDTRNIARIVLRMMKDGADLHPNEELFHKKWSNNHAHVCPLKREDVFDNDYEHTAIEDHVNSSEQDDFMEVKQNVEDKTSNETADKTIDDDKTKRQDDNRVTQQGDVCYEDEFSQFSDMNHLVDDINSLNLQEVDDLLAYFALQKS